MRTFVVSLLCGALLLQMPLCTLAECDTMTLGAVSQGETHARVLSGSASPLPCHTESSSTPIPAHAQHTEYCPTCTFLSQSNGVKDLPRFTLTCEDVLGLHVGLIPQEWNASEPSPIFTSGIFSACVKHSPFDLSALIQLEVLATSQASSILYICQKMHG